MRGWLVRTAAIRDGLVTTARPVVEQRAVRRSTAVIVVVINRPHPFDLVWWLGAFRGTFQFGSAGFSSSRVWVRPALSASPHTPSHKRQGVRLSPAWSSPAH